MYFHEIVITLQGQKKSLFWFLAANDIQHVKTAKLGIINALRGVLLPLQDDVLHRLKIKETHIAITQTWILESAVVTVKHALDYETFLLSTDTVKKSF